MGAIPATYFADRAVENINLFLLNQQPVKARMHGFFALAIFSAMDCGYLAGKTAVTGICAVWLKPLISVLGLLGVEVYMEMHRTLPGVTDVVFTAAKTVVCGLNIIICPILVLLSPDEAIKHLLKFSVANVPMAHNRPERDITFDDIIGLDVAKEHLRDQMLSPISLKIPGIKPARGALFYGPPGCGKTHLANALANELKCVFISINPATFDSKWKGESVKNIVGVFDDAIQKAERHADKVSVIFIDEADGILVKRSPGGDNTKFLDIDTITFLTCIEKATAKGVIVICATNRLNALDEASIRSGRIDMQIEVSLPTDEARRALFDYQFKKQGMPLVEKFPSEYIDDLVQRTAGFSNADITIICESACRAATMQFVKDNPGVDVTKRFETIPVNIIQTMLDEAVEGIQKKKSSTSASATSSNISPISGFPNGASQIMDQLVEAKVKAMLPSLVAAAIQAKMEEFLSTQPAAT
jgi:AAA+ superfamily predicted ATPase